MDIVSLDWAVLMVVFTFFPFTRSVENKWTLEALLIELRNQTVSIVL